MPRLTRPAIFLLLCFTLLAACRGNNNNDGNRTGNGQPAGTAATIRFADAGFKEALYAPLMAAFAAENPGYVIEYVPIEEAEDGRSGVLDMFTLASLADTMILPRPAAAEEGGYFLDAAGRTQESDYWPDTLAACRAGGVQAAFPLFLTPTLIFAHGDLFTAASVPLPAPGWTWDDFANAVSAATGENAAAEAVYGFTQGDSPAGLFSPTIDQLLSADRSGLDPAALTAAAGWYAELVNQGAVLLPGDTEEDVQQLIEAGRVAMWLDSPANLPTMRNRLGPDLLALPFPEGEDDAAGTPVQPACAAVSAGTGQADMAWAWLDFLAQNPFVSRRGEIPGRMAIAESSGFWANLDEDVAATYRYALDHAWYGRIDGAIETVAAALNEAFTAGADAETAFSEIETLPTPTPVPTAAAPPVVEEAAPITVFEGEEGLIRYFDGSFDANMATVRELAADFTNQTGVQFQFNDFFTVSDASGGIQPDAMFATIAANHDCMIWRGNLPTVFQQQVMPIEEMLSERYPEVLADYAPYTLEQARHDGVLYGLPLVLEPQMLFVNRERFERKDIPLPAAGWSVAELESIAAQMPLGEGRSQIYGFVPYGEFNIDAYEPLLALYGAMPFDLGAASPAVYFDYPATIAALEQIRPQVAAGIVAPFDGGGTRSAQGNTNEMGQVIESGRGTIWNENLTAASGRFGFLVGTTFAFQAVPYPASSVPLPAPNMERLFIFAEATNPEACLDWIVTLTDNPQVSGGIPARVSWRESATWTEEVGADAAAVLRDTADRSTKLPGNEGLYRPVFQWWQDALAEIWAGADIAGTLGVAQEIADAYIACIAAADLSLEAVGESIRSCAVQADPNYPVATE